MEEDQLLPQPAGENILPPSPLSPRQEELCKKLDELHASDGLKVKPSDMFRGAIFAMRSECRTNPDWIAQVGHSLREILYPIWSNREPSKNDIVFKKYGSVSIDDEKVVNEVMRVYGLLNDLAHHGCKPLVLKKDFSAFTPSELEILLVDFENVMFDALVRQVDMHSQADQLIGQDPTI